MKRIVLLLALVLTLDAKSPRARNVILFLADAAGLSTINAASIHGYRKPQSLYIQSWTNLALSDTSTASQWVTDSAAGMTAIVTGVKTHNGVISQGPDAVRGKQDGAPLKTILEYAEEKGLATGVVTNMNIADATPAACYAHQNDRRKFGEIFLEIFTPRFGDGVDVVIGGGRQAVYSAVEKLGRNLDEVAAAKGRPVRARLADIPAAELRPVVVQDEPVDVPAASLRALDILSRSRKGYFLMIEWDAHTDDPERGLNAMVGFDKLIREIAGRVDLRDTLLLFTADHSFDLRTRGGLHTDAALKGFAEWKAAHPKSDPIRLPVLRVEDGHTGEEVLAAAQGPGAQQLRGFLPNTRLFEVMLNAFGWKR
jgi:alkaline phosphatase